MDWRPIDTAPKDGTPILVWAGHGWSGSGPVVRTAFRLYWMNEFLNGSAPSWRERDADVAESDPDWLVTIRGSDVSDAEDASDRQKANLAIREPTYKCQLCGDPIAGGDDRVAFLRSPVDSFHHFHHLKCFVADESAKFERALYDVSGSHNMVKRVMEKLGTKSQLFPN